MKNLRTLFVTLLFFHPISSMAFSVLGQGFFPGTQYPDEDSSVYGLRLSPGLAVHKEMIGLDLGVVGNITSSRFIGLSMAGGFNATNGTTTVIGMQLAGVMNLNKAKTTVVGMQVALGINSNTMEAKVIGLQFAAVNEAPKTDIYGVQSGIYSRAGNIYGIQNGIYCRANNVFGVQLCIVNDTENLYGIQFGVLNFVRNGPIKFMPIINVGF